MMLRFAFESFFVEATYRAIDYGSTAYDGICRMPCQIGYQFSDPYAVRIRFHESDHDNDWVFSRDLLAEALETLEPVGIGDVIITRENTIVGYSLAEEIDENYIAVVFLDLQNDDGAVRVVMEDKTLRQFLALTKYFIPIGKESMYLALPDPEEFRTI